MKKKLSVILFLLLGTFSFAQDHWINKEVGNNIFVKFPNTPAYNLKETSGSYTAKTENGLFIVIIQYNSIPHYTEFVKLPLPQREMLVNHLLDNYVKGRSIATNKEISSNKIKLGSLIGRGLIHSAVNPANGEVGQRFSKTFVVGDKIYSFECWYLNNSQQSENEKDIFLNSISTTF